MEYIYLHVGSFKTDMQNTIMLVLKRIDVTCLFKMHTIYFNPCLTPSTPIPQILTLTLSLVALVSLLLTLSTLKAFHRRSPSPLPSGLNQPPLMHLPASSTSSPLVPPPDLPSLRHRPPPMQPPASFNTTVSNFTHLAIYPSSIFLGFPYNFIL